MKDCKTLSQVERDGSTNNEVQGDGKQLLNGTSGGLYEEHKAATNNKTVLS